MAQVVNNDKLTFIITEQGLNRIAELISDPTDTLQLSKIKIGDARGEYYTPSEEQTALVHPIPGGEFYLSEKELLEDGLTISLLAVIPESSSGYDIREVGLYETRNGEDVLFAVGTQQPIVKPSVDDNYIMSVDYYIFLKSQNLAEVYERIVLDPENQLITDRDLSELMRTVLFSQTNLMDQIGHNSYTIGLNRAAQLQERIVADITQMANFTSFSNYIDLYNTVGDTIFSYWLFDYPKKANSYVSITDLSKNGYNLTVDQSINLFSREYVGLTPCLKMEAPHNFTLSLDAPLSFLNEDKTSDIDFSILFGVSPLSTSGDRTILARSNYAAGVNIFEVKELSTGALQVKLFAGSSSYLTFTSANNVIPNAFHVIVISYNSSSKTITAFIDGVGITMTRVETGTYTHMNPALATLYSYTVNPVHTIYVDNSSTPTVLYNEDGSLYTGDAWTISNNNVFYYTELASIDSAKDTETDTLYGWASGSSSVYTKSLTITENTVLYNSDYSLYTGTLFSVAEVGGIYRVLFNGGATTQSGTIPSKTIYAFSFEDGQQFIWANSSTQPSALFLSNGDQYLGTDWTISSNKVYYKNSQASYNSSFDRETPFVGASSYITDANGDKIDHINSKVAFIAVAKQGITDTEARALCLLYSATLGQSPCILLS